MPNFRYRALTQGGEIVSGVIAASSTAEVTRRIEYLRLVLIDTVVEDGSRRGFGLNLNLGSQGRSEEVTIFTLDLALILKAGARLDEALELLATDVDIGRLRSTVTKVRASVLSGESLADALSRHTALFPPIYVALIRVGEASGKLDHILELLANERSRAETLRRKLADALRYPAFLLFAASCVLIFFLMFVMPQFGGVLHDFGAKISPIVAFFLGLSEFMAEHKQLLASLLLAVLLAGLWLARQARVRTTVLTAVSRLPVVRSAFAYYRTALFCRNLAVLLGAGVALTATLRILAEMMATTGHAAVWTSIVEKVRQGGKLSEALADQASLPAMAIRMLRLGEETGQLPTLASRIAEFYETKLHRRLDRVVGIVGPLAIIGISIVVGGLIVSVMTSLLSVSQLVG
jgi:general secretion pathway protein F